ncbi:MAG TPA: MltA domain-containing protein [Tepidisphaeraceae bacterium]|jgi:membrane-bound lytic murein transglycosylase A
MRKTLCLSTLLVLLITLAGCHHNKINYNAPLPQGQLALVKIDPSQYPDFSFSQTDLSRLNRALDYSLQYLRTRSSQQFFPYLDISHDRAVNTLLELKQIINDPSQAAQINSIVRQRFDVYKSIGAPDPEKAGGYTGEVQYTGYYTPIYEASATRTGEYQYPLYKRPTDLYNDPTGTMASRRTADGQYVLYYTRDQIEHSGVLAGHELVWLKSRWDAYVITVQGSAILHMTDGRTLEIGYSANNGYPYTSPGRQMLADRAISEDQLSLHGLSDYFQAHPEAMDKYLDINQRYVFFAIRPGGPFGCLNVPVTPFATIATDKAVYPRALMSFVVVQLPAQQEGQFVDWKGFMLDQDAGGAIRAAGRSDIYMGIGPAAGQLAGRQLQTGTLYYLAIK